MDLLEKLETPDEKAGLPSHDKLCKKNILNIKYETSENYLCAGPTQNSNHLKFEQNFTKQILKDTKCKRLTRAE